jgi:hypothetical protein
MKIQRLGVIARREVGAPPASEIGLSHGWRGDRQCEDQCACAQKSMHGASSAARAALSFRRRSSRNHARLEEDYKRSSETNARIGETVGARTAYIELSGRWENGYVGRLNEKLRAAVATAEPDSVHSPANATVPQASNNHSISGSWRFRPSP